MHLVCKFLYEILPVRVHRYHWTEKLSCFRPGERLRQKQSDSSGCVRQLCEVEWIYFGKEKQTGQQRKGGQSKVVEGKMSRVWSDAEVKREGEISGKES